MKRLTLCDVNEKPCFFALGYFDGVHLGHKAVIKKAVEESKKRGIASAVFTFETHKKQNNGNILSLDERLLFIEELGVDFALVCNFPDVSSLSHGEFLTLLKDKFSAKGFCCGEDFRYGKNAQGNIDFLKDFCAQNSLEAFVTEPVFFEGEKVSSTKIRQALLNGEIELANKLLGREYSIIKEVVSGEHIGSKMLYPTVNQPLDDALVLLKYGVYASRAKIDNKNYAAVTNIGICPTVKKCISPVAETYILDENINLYGKKIKIELLSFLREEKTFLGVEELKKQISKDIETARKMF